MKEFNNIRLNTKKGHKRHSIAVKRKLEGKIYGRPKPFQKIGDTSYFKLAAPERLNVYKNGIESTDYIETLEFTSSLDKAIRKSNTLVDFTKTTKLKAAAIVLLYSTAERALSQSDNKLKIRLSSNEKVNRVLKQSNFKKLIERREMTTQIEEYSTLPIISGTNAEYTDEIVDHIQKKVYSDNLTPEDEQVLSNAIMEAIENVALHAYEKSTQLENKKWWMQCEVFGNQLFLVIYDQGVGIPNTVKDKVWFEKVFKKEYPAMYNELKQNAPIGASILDLLKINPIIKDGNLIYLSMQGEYSSTEDAGRGQGSKSIRTLVTENDDGILWVYSGNGLYIFKEDELEPEVIELPQRFQGTLIQWNIRIK